MTVVMEKLSPNSLTINARETRRSEANPHVSVPRTRSEKVDLLKELLEQYSQGLMSDDDFVVHSADIMNLPMSYTN